MKKSPLDCSEFRILQRQHPRSATRRLGLLRNHLGLTAKAWQFRLGRLSDQGVVICRPRGGLNDTLNQLAKTFVYSYRFHRRLVIDTSRSGLLDHWDNYFELADPHWPILSNICQWKSSPFATFMPNVLRSCGVGYEAVVDSNYRIRDGVSGVEVTFDMDKTHDAEVLVHEQYGGGYQGWIALQLFRFTASTGHEILKSVRCLPPSYAAIHVRHSDVKSDYHQIFAGLRKRLNKKEVVICTDSAEVQAAAVEELKDSNVIILNQVPSTNGATLHDNPELASRELNIATFVDLIALARAEELILTMAAPCQRIWPGRRGGYASGFGTLAADLFERPGLLKQLFVASRRGPC